MVRLFIAAILLAASPVSARADAPALADAQRAFFNARYQTAADLALALQASDAEALAPYEVRTSALHFQLRDALGQDTDKGQSLQSLRRVPRAAESFSDRHEKGASARSHPITEGPCRRRCAVLPGETESELRVAAARDAWPQNRLERGPGKRGGRSTPPSRTIRGTCARASRGHGSTTSSTRK